MASCSRYFKALFETYECNSGGQKPVITLPGINQSELTKIIEFAYKQEVHIDNECIQDLAIAADQFSVLDLLQDCISFCLDNMDCDNCIGIWRFATFYSFIKLRNKAKKFILEKFPEIIDSEKEEFFELEVDELQTLLQNNRLNVATESIVWIAIVKWVNFDEQSRMRHYSRLLKTVRLGTFMQSFIEGVMRNHPYSRNNNECVEYLSGYSRFVNEAGRSIDLSEIPSFCWPRESSYFIYAIGGWSGSNPTSATEIYNYKLNEWINITPYCDLLQRAYHGCVALEQTIYLIGGTGGVHFLNDCWRFNTSDNRLAEIGPMHEKRCYVSVAILDGIIYAVGGNDGAHRLRTVEAYKPALNQWTYVASMNSIRSDATVSVLDGKLYAIGGFDGSECLNTAEVYNPTTNTWSDLPNMATHRSGVSSAVLNNRIFVLGGSTGRIRLRSMDVYDQGFANWMPMASMNEPRSNFSTCVINNFIIAIGGFNGFTTIPNVEFYNPNHNTWYVLAPMAISRSALKVCCVKNAQELQENTNN